MDAPNYAGLPYALTGQWAGEDAQVRLVLGCFYKLWVLFVAVLIVGPYYLESRLGPLIFGKLFSDAQLT